MQHSLAYKFKCDPVFLLAKYTEDGKKLNYDGVVSIARNHGLSLPPLLARGIAIEPEVVIRQYPKGLVGSRDGIEGIVYVYEHAGQFEGTAKFVSNLIIGTMKVIPDKFNQRV